jgi:rubrerythrin
MAEDLLVEFVGEKVKKELLAQVQDSIREEEAAIDVYRRRADYCRRGYPKIAEIYDHIRKEEEHHREEFLALAKKIRQFETPMRRRWPGWKRKG